MSATVALTSEQPLPVRLLRLLAVLGYTACYVFGLYAGIRRRSPAFSAAAVLLGMATLFLVLAGIGSGVYTVAFLVVGVIMLVPGRWGTVGAVAASASAVLAVWLLSGALGWGDVIGTMARDLHDVLGHSLTTITVKAGLARRLLEAGERDRAADEVADVERLGRQALSDVRATVAANRVASLPREFAGAAEALGPPGSPPTCRTRRRRPGRAA